MLLLNLRMICDDVPVAEEAFVHRRHPRVDGPVHIWVAEPALDLLHTGMHPVAEADGLRGANGGSGGCVEKVEKPQRQNHAES